MPHATRTCGFRFSVADLIFILTAIGGTWWLWPTMGAWTGIIPLVVGHFFLFCNVFRIHRSKELWWAGSCLCNICGWYIADLPWWPGILMVQLPVTTVVIAWEMRGPWYHGVFADRINKHLTDYLEARI